MFAFPRLILVKLSFIIILLILAKPFSGINARREVLLVLLWERSRAGGIRFTGTVAEGITGGEIAGVGQLDGELFTGGIQEFPFKGGEPCGRTNPGSGWWRDR